jgi:hypothetical protein
LLCLPRIDWEVVRVYHYLEARWALDDIRKRRLKLSKLDDMNDPYEWQCVLALDEHSRQVLDKTYAQVAEKFSVQCFSRSWNNILMWSHYGDRHKGICLGFDVPDEFTREIRYVRGLVPGGKVGGRYPRRKNNTHRYIGGDKVQRLAL